MKTKIQKTLQIILFSIVLILPMFALSLPARAETADLWGGKKTDLANASGLVPDGDPRLIIAKALRVVMGFLGIVCVAIILWGGFEWMTSGGNQEKAATARKRIVAGIIGLLIILSAFVIATFVIDNLNSIVGA